jgi:hypothetical protein
MRARCCQYHYWPCLFYQKLTRLLLLFVPFLTAPHQGLRADITLSQSQLVDSQSQLLSQDVLAAFDLQMDDLLDDGSRGVDGDSDIASITGDGIGGGGGGNESERK